MARRIDKSQLAFAEIEILEYLSDLIDQKIHEETGGRLNREFEFNPGDLIMIGEEVCPNCDAIRQLYSDQMGNDWITYYDENHPIGKQFTELFDISYIPFIIFYDSVNNIYWECEWYGDSDGSYDIICPFKNGRRLNNDHK